LVVKGRQILLQKEREPLQMPFSGAQTITYLTLSDSFYADEGILEPMTEVIRDKITAETKDLRVVEPAETSVSSLLAALESEKRLSKFMRRFDLFKTTSATPLPLSLLASHLNHRQNTVLFRPA